MYIYYTRIYILHNFFVHSSVDEHLCYFLVLGTVNSWRRKWQPTPVLLPGKSHGRRSLVGYSPWSHKESDATEQLHFTHFVLYLWRRKWQLTQVFLSGDAHWQRSLAGHGPWGRRESDTTEVAEQALWIVLLWILGCMYLWITVFSRYMPRSGIAGSYDAELYPFIINL